MHLRQLTVSIPLNCRTETTHLPKPVDSFKVLPAAIKSSQYIGASNIIIMSGNHANVTANPAPPYTLPAAPSFLIKDDRGQQMPAGTTVVATISAGAGSIVGPSSYTWPCTSAPGGMSFSFSMVPPTSNPVAGSLILTITTPGKLVTTYQYPLTN